MKGNTESSSFSVLEVLVNPRLPEPLFVTSLPYHPSLDFRCKASDSYIILVLEDRYESPFSIDTKTVQVALHLTSK